MVEVTAQRILPDDLGLPSDFNVVAENTLTYLETAVASAKDKLASSRRGLDVHSLASINTMTSDAAASFDVVETELRRALHAVIDCPAVARVEVINEAGDNETFFITPGGAPLPRIGEARTVSYRSPAGRLAAIEVGTDLEVHTPLGVKTYELVAREKLRPELGLEGWDARDTVVERCDVVPWTVRSLRALLKALPLSDNEGLALLDQLLGEGGDDNVSRGIRRSIIERMGLRQQHSLDTYQDEIFRLPLDRQVSILGAPGTGKTTTLIKRLGQKLDREALEGERALVARTLAGPEGHATSWMMFSPTELLRLYVREAFNRERIVASDRQVVVWDGYRRLIARDHLSILRGTNSRSGAVLRPGSDNLLATAIEDPIGWLEDFDGWQRNAFWIEMLERTARVAQSQDARLQKLVPILRRIGEDGRETVEASPFQRLHALSRELSEQGAARRAEVHALLRGALAKRLTEDNKLIDKLNDFVKSLGDPSDASDDLDEIDVDDDEDEGGTSRNGREEAFSAYERAFRAKARSIVSGRRLGPKTRNGRIVEWLGQRGPDDETLKKIGAAVTLGDALRSLSTPVRKYLRNMTRRYRLYRRDRLSEGRWYGRSTVNASEMGPLELDIVLLATLKAGRSLMRDRDLFASINEPALTDLLKVRNLLRTQILVDEATDFSPIQLSCMASLCDPETDSFFICGDFNQRVTEWGCRRQQDLIWVHEGIDIRHVDITYRHSRQLNVLAHRLASLSRDDHEEAALPQHVNNDGVDPVLGLDLSGDRLVQWLAERIGEIESLTSTLPSVAILVNSEEEVQSVARALDPLLAKNNIRCFACVGGQSVGNENEVRVFDVEHIKGLEFEAVFFVGVDGLAESRPDLFDKFLYVGATRAAMYLGITTSGTEMPERLLPIQDAFISNWR